MLPKAKIPISPTPPLCGRPCEERDRTGHTLVPASVRYTDPRGRGATVPAAALAPAVQVAREHAHFLPLQMQMFGAVPPEVRIS